MALETLQDIENCMNSGWTDGLPVIPPYGSVVNEMLDAMGWRADEIIGEFPEHNVVVRAEQAAATAVMAGCATEYGSLLRSLSEALLDPKLNICGAEVTTGGASLLVVVSGSVVSRLGFEHGENALGANRRANATVGRFAQMMRLFCGRAGGVLQAHGTIGHPGRISFCVAEHPETEWGAYHTQFGLPEGASAVSVMSTEGPNSVNNHYGDTGAQVLDTIGDCMCHYGQTAWYYRSGGFVVVIAPDHVALVSKEFGRDEADYLAWVDDVEEVAARFPGYRGTTYKAQGEGDECHVVYRFDTVEHLKDWEESDERRHWTAKLDGIAEGESRIDRLTGLEFLFRDQLHPNAHKMALVLTATIFLLVLTLNPLFVFLAAAVPAVPDWLLLLVRVILQVALLTYVIMPRIMRVLEPWL